MRFHSVTYRKDHNARRELTGVLDQRAASGYLPQFDHRVFAAGQDVLGVLGEDGGADLGSVVGLVEGGDAAVGDAVPQLDAAVLAAGHVAVGRGVVAHAADGVRVLVQRVARHEALEGVDVIEAQRGVLRANEQEVSRRVEGDGTQHFCFLLEADGDRISIRHSDISIIDIAAISFLGINTSIWYW